MAQGKRGICRITRRGRGGEAKTKRDKRAELSIFNVVDDENNTAEYGRTIQIFWMTIDQQVDTGDIERC